LLVLGVWPGVDERREELRGDGVRHLKRAEFVTIEYQWLEGPERFYISDEKPATWNIGMGVCGRSCQT
jgi:hypothetical protein